MLKKSLMALLAANSLMGTASWADEQASGVRPFIGAGFTVGGEKIATVSYTDGTEKSVTAGGLLDLRAGVDYRFANSPVSIQGSIGYHVDDASAKNGSVRFSRVPVELLVHYFATESWKIGGGIRQSTGTALSASGEARVTIRDLKFTSSLAPLIEAEYLVSPKFGVKMRYVNEEYKIENTNSTIDGSHFGVIAMYYFN